jgi:hypothetical protein
MGQGGNVYEWMETAYDGTNDSVGEDGQLRGGVWGDFSFFLLATLRDREQTTTDREYIMSGFRIASVPEPSSLSLLALGGVLEALRRRRK